MGICVVRVPMCGTSCKLVIAWEVGIVKLSDNLSNLNRIFLRKRYAALTVGAVLEYFIEPTTIQ